MPFLNSTPARVLPIVLHFRKKLRNSIIMDDGHGTPTRTPTTLFSSHEIWTHKSTISYHFGQSSPLVTHNADKPQTPTRIKMMYKFLLSLLFVVSFSTIELVSATKMQTAPRIKQSAFFGRDHRRQHDSEPSNPESLPTAFLTGLIKDVSEAIKEDFQAPSRSCERGEIIHECVVNYSWGLVGNF